MMIEYDEKGKFYTDVISKDVVLSLIQMQDYLIKGYIHVCKGKRLSDEINKDNNFLAVTSVEIYSPNGEILFTSEFVAINLNQILWLMPIEESQKMSGMPDS
jgi:hypothetical protein